MAELGAAATVETSAKAGLIAVVASAQVPAPSSWTAPSVAVSASRAAAVVKCSAAMITSWTKAVAEPTEVVAAYCLSLIHI